jgi:hypothetical protein
MAALVAVQFATESPQADSGLTCGDDADLRQMLARQFGEMPAQSETAADGSKLELFASARANTWTAVNVASDGRGCVVAVGQDWRQLLIALKGQPV